MGEELFKDYIDEMKRRQTAKTKKFDIDYFIENHTYINYCEAIVYPDGRIAYVRPNHLYTLIRETGKTEDEVYDIMPIYESPLDWLVEYTKCIAVWSDGIKVPKIITDEQVKTLKKLKEAKLTQINFW